LTKVEAIMGAQFNTLAAVRTHTQHAYRRTHYVLVP
jgi:hypothetical protein